MNETIPAQKNSGLAISSLVLGLMAYICFLGPLAGVAAVICGHVALSAIKKSGNLLGGRGLAIGGLVMGYLSFVMIPVIGLLAAIAIPNFVKAKVTAQSNACVNNMRAIDNAIQQWALEKGKAKTDAIDEVAVATYMRGGVIPQCPAGGSIFSVRRWARSHR